MKSVFPLPFRVVGFIIIASALSGCASLSKHGDEASIRQQVATYAGTEQAVVPSTADARATTRDALLAKPLSMDDAVALALLNNPTLPGMFAELRISEAEFIAASRPRNPRITLGRLTQADVTETDRSVMVDVLGLLALPIRAPFATQQYKSAQLQTTQSVLVLAHDARLAYIDAVASAQRASYAQAVQDAAEAGRDLAQSLAKLGNISQLDAARERVFYEEAIAQRNRAELVAQVAREQLLRILGISDSTTLQLPTSLPVMPAQSRDFRNVEQLALNQRIDVQQATLAAETTARALKFTKTTHFINVLDVGLQRNNFTNQPRQSGVEVSLELPLFDGGRIRVAQADAIYQRALAHVAEVAINARSEARLAYVRYQGAWTLAQHYRDVIAPLQRQIANETLLRFNGMLISTFELLAQTRQQIASTDAGLAALEDFWKADTLLTGVLQGKSNLQSAQLEPSTSRQEGTARE